MNARGALRRLRFPLAVALLCGGCSLGQGIDPPSMSDGADLGGMDLGSSTGGSSGPDGANGTGGSGPGGASGSTGMGGEGGSQLEESQ